MINLTNGDDSFAGTNGRDTVYGLGGDDVIKGAGGDDALNGDAGSDTLFGGAGNDFLQDEGNLAYLYGGSGNDRLLSDTAHGYFDGGSGEDRADITSTRNHDTYDMASGTVFNDRIWYNGLQNVGQVENIENLWWSGLLDIRGSEGDDTIRVTSLLNGHVLGNGGNDVLQIRDASTGRYYGGDGDDHLSYIATSFLDDDHDFDAPVILDGGAGNDRIIATNPDRAIDFIFGGSGDDEIETSYLVGLVAGGLGEDTIRTGIAGQTISGGAGDDLIELAGTAAGERHTLTYTAFSGHDVITGFDIARPDVDGMLLSDVFDLRSYSLGGLDFIGSENFSAAGQLRAEFYNGFVFSGGVPVYYEGTIVQISTDGDAAAEVSMNLVGFAGTLTEDQFML